MTRGLRNRNPGNIRKSGTAYMGEVIPSQDTAFKQFETMAWGYRAVFVLLDSYRRRGYTTLRQMIARYAPPVENDTGNYVRCISAWSGIDADEPLDTNDRTTMLAVVAAISRMENGREAVMSDVEAGWTLFMQHKP